MKLAGAGPQVRQNSSEQVSPPPHACAGAAQQCVASVPHIPVPPPVVSVPAWALLFELLELPQAAIPIKWESAIAPKAFVRIMMISDLRAAGKGCSVNT